MMRFTLPESLLGEFKKLTPDEVGRCVKWQLVSAADAKRHDHSSAFEAYLQMKASTFFVHFCGDVKGLNDDKAADTRIEMAILLKKPTVLFANPEVEKTGIIDKWKRQGLDVKQVVNNTNMSPTEAKELITKIFNETTGEKITPTVDKI